MVSINPEMIKSIASKAGNAFNKIMASGNIPEGSIFDAASKLGINNTDDLKGIFEKVKQNPTETIGNALNQLQEKGFRLGEVNLNKTQETAAVDEAPVAPQEDTSQIEDKSANPLDGVLKTLKSAGLDVNDGDVQKNMSDFADSPDKLKKFIAQKLGLSGEGLNQEV